MTDPKRALILHLTSGGEPLYVALPAETADDLARRLPELVRKGEVTIIETENRASMVVNFHHVVAAHVDVVSGLTTGFGAAPRERNAISGFRG
jgi:hypothetical protein